MKPRPSTPMIVRGWRKWVNVAGIRFSDDQFGHRDAVPPQEAGAVDDVVGLFEHARSGVSCRLFHDVENVTVVPSTRSSSGSGSSMPPNDSTAPLRGIGAFASLRSHLDDRQRRAVDRIDNPVGARRRGVGVGVIRRRVEHQLAALAGGVDAVDRQRDRLAVGAFERHATSSPTADRRRAPSRRRPAIG